jgi:hypothetical protein
MRTIVLSRLTPVGFTGKLVDVDKVRITDSMRWHMKHKVYVINRKANKNEADKK